VERELSRNGAVAGDPVRIGGYEFTFEPVIVMQGEKARR
jgi:hypothetical protein